MLSSSTGLSMPSCHILPWPLHTPDLQQACTPSNLYSMIPPRHEDRSVLIGFLPATGQTKDETPVALRLRSGDAVVMAGPARMCYHGIPRVLREAGAADSRGAASGGVGGGDEGSAAIAEHMCGTRINISIRASR